MKSLWSGRFEKNMDDAVKKFNASIEFDKRLYNEDILGSIAHVKMLAEKDIISEAECEEIIKGLEIILEKIQAGEIVFGIDD